MCGPICERLLNNAWRKRFIFRRNINLVVLAGVFCVVNGILASGVQADSDAQPVIKKYSAVARKSLDFNLDNGNRRLDFGFDGATAWVRENGDFQVDAEIKHQWLLCGTYEVGIRFGIGNPSCTNVSWISEPHYVSRRKQCNNAWMAHTGNGNDAEVPGDFVQLSCAQLLIKCTGKCK